VPSGLLFARIRIQGKLIRPAPSITKKTHAVADQKSKEEIHLPCTIPEISAIAVLFAGVISTKACFVPQTNKSNSAMRLETHGVPNKCLMNSPLVQRATGRKQLVGENCKAFGHSNAQKKHQMLGCPRVD